MKTLKSCKKITLASVKAFAKRNVKNLYSKELSRFDGMIDCVSSVEDSFTKTKINENSEREFIGGCWLVGSSRDSFSIYEDSIFFGIRIYNCCGSSIVAVKKEKQPEPELIDWDTIFDEPEPEKTEAFEIVKTKHTLKGFDLWVVKLVDRVSKDAFNDLLSTAKKFGGWYSAFNKNGAIAGFQFKSEESANEFTVNLI